MFEKNESTADRLVRAGAGTALVAAGAVACATHRRPLGALSALVGGVLLITAASGCCPLYRALHFGTAN
jgi:hypothetical protein